MESQKGGNLLDRLSRFHLRCFDYYIKHYRMVTVVVTILLLSIILLLGWFSERKVLLEGFAIAITIVAGLFLVNLLQRWSRTVSKQVEIKTRELNRSEHLYRSLVENANDIIFTISPEGTILSMNSYGSEFFCKSPAEVIGRDIGEPFAIDGCEVRRDIERSILTSIALDGAPLPLPVGERVTLWAGPNVVFVGKAVDEANVLDLLSTESDDALDDDETI